MSRKSECLSWPFLCFDSTFISKSIEVSQEKVLANSRIFIGHVPKKIQKVKKSKHFIIAIIAIAWILLNLYVPIPKQGNHYIFQSMFSFSGSFSSSTISVDFSGKSNSLWWIFQCEAALQNTEHWLLWAEYKIFPWNPHVLEACSPPGSIWILRALTYSVN